MTLRKGGWGSAGPGRTGGFGGTPRARPTLADAGPDAEPDAHPARRSPQTRRSGSSTLKRSTRQLGRRNRQPRSGRRPSPSHQRRRGPVSAARTSDAEPCARLEKAPALPPTLGSTARSAPSPGCLAELHQLGAGRRRSASPAMATGPHLLTTRLERRPARDPGRAAPRRPAVVRTRSWKRGRPVRLIHLLELRSALAEAYTAAGRSTTPYSDAPPRAGATPIRATHVMELRAAVVALE